MRTPHSTFTSKTAPVAAQEVNRRMKDKAAHACHVLYRARVVEEIRRRKGTLTADHLKLVLNAIEGPRFPQKDE